MPLYLPVHPIFYSDNQLESPIGFFIHCTKNKVFYEGFLQLSDGEKLKENTDLNTPKAVLQKTKFGPKYK